MVSYNCALDIRPPSPAAGDPSIRYIDSIHRNDMTPDAYRAGRAEVACRGTRFGSQPVALSATCVGSRSWLPVGSPGERGVTRLTREQHGETLNESESRRHHTGRRWLREVRHGLASAVHECRGAENPGPFRERSLIALPRLH